MQNGTIVRRGDWWYLRYYEPILLNGEVVKRQKARKLVRYSREEYPDRRAVMKSGRVGEILAPINTRTATPESTLPVIDFLEHRYLPDIQQTKKPSTYQGYTDSFKVLKSYLGALELREVRTVHIQRILDAVAAAKPRANSSMKHLKAFLSGAFGHAVRLGLIQGNPVGAARSPRGLPPGETYACRFAEVQKMLRALDEPARTIVLTMSLTGLRMNELSGLKWDDIRGDELYVSRQVWHGQVIETKTEDSKAAIPLVATVKRALEKHRRLSVGEFVFTGPRDGKPVLMDNIKRRSIEPRLKKEGLVWHGWHSFRRGLATELKRLGVDDLTIARILRHGGGTVTQAHYIKTVPETARTAMRKAERVFLASSPFVLFR